MKIELTHIKVRDLVDEFSDSDENGVTGYHGLLDIRPQYQREYVYTPDKRDAVIDTLMKGFPLNIMYWVKRKDALDISGFENYMSSMGYAKTKDLALNVSF